MISTVSGALSRRTVVALLLAAVMSGASGMSGPVVAAAEVHPSVLPWLDLADAFDPVEAVARGIRDWRNVALVDRRTPSARQATPPSGAGTVPDELVGRVLARLGEPVEGRS